MESEDILSAVVKRARGYIAMETVEEYAVVDGSLELIKKRITTKDVPPDMTAAKMLFDESDFSSMTDEMLEAERRRLLLELEEENKAEEKNKSKDDSARKEQTKSEGGIQSKPPLAEEKALADKEENAITDTKGELRLEYKTEGT